MKIFLASFASLVIASEAVCSTPATLTCKFTPKKPKLDGNLKDWSKVQGIETDLYNIFSVEYYGGAATYKCLYDNSHIYFALSIPGPYRFDSADNHKCASVSTMFKVGKLATFVDMGGCQDALFEGACSSGVPPQCDEYRVDIGAHWELSGTEQGTLYAMDSTLVSGNDPVANLDDEYAVSPYCRFDDGGEGAGNEWSGAWAHTNSSEIGAEGDYLFELSRLLQTKTNATDLQVLSPGDTYSFGIAYWDPFETEATGWSDADHFLTGCANQWIDLVLEAPKKKKKKATKKPKKMKKKAAKM
jgi:hypothetical protein